MEQLQSELKELIVSSLFLENVLPSEINSDALLFGDDGLALNSIDALRDRGGQDAEEIRRQDRPGGRSDCGTLQNRAVARQIPRRLALGGWYGT